MKHLVQRDLSQTVTAPETGVHGLFSFTGSMVWGHDRC